MAASKWGRIGASAWVVALWGCTCDVVNIQTAPGKVNAVMCNPVSGQKEAGHTLHVDAKDGAHETQSRADGSASLNNLPAGQVSIRLKHLVAGQAEPRLDHVVEMELKQGETVTVLDPACLDVPLTPGRGAIQGQVCNRHTGTLITDATVTAVSSTGEMLTTQTDMGGYFLINDVAAGDYVVTIRGTGYQRAFPAHVEAGEVTQLQLGANCNPFNPGDTGAVGGQLCIENGAGPWALASVKIVLGDGSVLEETTDIHGEFLLEGVPPGEHDVVVSGSGEAATYHVTVTAGQTTPVAPPQDCPVPNNLETGEVRGQLCDPDVGGWLVGALAQATQGARVFRDHTDEHGRFHLAGLMPGEVQVDITKGTYSRTFTVPITVGTTVTVADGVCAPPTWQCKDQALTLNDAAPLRIMLLVDKSGSMQEDGLDGPKWDSAKAALKAVTLQLDTAAQFGLALFPAGDQFSASCEAGTVVVNPGVSNAGAIGSALDRAGPGGGTPTGPSVGAVHQWLAANPVTAATLVILATDGVPNCNDFLDGAVCACPVPLCPQQPVACCASDPRQCCLEASAQCLDDVATITAISSMAAANFPTYVIGLPGSEDPTDVLTRMAQAGGTNAGNGHAYYRPTSTSELIGDMTSIVQNNRSCRFELSGVPNDPQQMEVRLNGTTIPRDQGRRSGWDLAGERSVELYGPACQALRTGTSNTLLVHFCTDA